MEITTIYTNNEHIGQKFTMPSVTVPNQEMTIEEIIQRFANGQSLDMGKQTYYGGEDFESEDPTQRLDFDLIEAEQLKDTLQDSIVESKQKIKDQQIRDKKEAADKKSADSTKQEGSSVADDAKASAGQAKNEAANREAADKQ